MLRFIADHMTHDAHTEIVGRHLNREFRLSEQIKGLESDVEQLSALVATLLADDAGVEYGPSHPKTKARVFLAELETRKLAAEAATTTRRKPR